MAENIKAATGRQQGSALIVALFVLMVICLMGAAVLSAAAVERKVVASQNRVELLRQAADGGIQVARNVIMNYMAVGQAIPDIGDISLENGLRVEISCDLANMNDNGVISITSRAYMEDAYGMVIGSKAVRAELLVDCLPGCAVRAKTVTLAGRYLSTVSGKAIDEMGNQDWDVNNSEARLAGDPELPYFYPLNGPSYYSLQEKYQINHPYLNINDQHWPGIPDHAYSWWMNYQHASLDEEGFHDLEHSMINIAPFYNPYGYLEIVDKEGRTEQIGLEQGWDDALTADEQNELFVDNLSSPVWGCPVSEEYYQSQVINTVFSSENSVIYPAKEFNSQDFIKMARVLENVPAPALSSELMGNYRQLACLDPEWEYVAENSDKLRFNSGKYEVDINGLDQTYIFIDRPDGDTVLLDFNALLIPTGCCLTDWLAASKGMFFNLIENQGRSVIIISTANLNLIMDNIMFEHLNSDTHFYIISQGNINLTLDPVILEYPSSTRNIQAFLWAGEDIHIHSGVSECNYSGFIYSGNQLCIKMENPDGIQAEEPYLRIEKNPAVIQQFPESWVYLGMAPIIAYTCLD